MLALVLLKVGDGAIALDIDPRPRPHAVVDDGELLLTPRGVVVDEVAVHHPFTAVGVAFLEHHQAGRPVLEGALRVGILQRLADLDLQEAIDVAVGAAVRDGLSVEGAVLVVHMDVAEDEAIAGREEATEPQQRQRG